MDELVKTMQAMQAQIQSNQNAINGVTAVLERLNANQERLYSKPLVNSVQNVSATTAPEQLMDILSKSIKEFSYDPVNNLTFGVWYARYEQLFVVDAASLNDAAKVRLLLRKLSTEVHDKYLDHLLPKHPHEFRFDETVHKLKSLFGSQKSKFSLRFECLNLAKREDDDYVAHSGRVNRLYEDAELRCLTPEHFKCLIFIMSLKSPSDADIRLRLLNILDNDDGKNEVQLKELVAEVHRCRSLAADTSMIENPVEVNAVQKSHQKGSLTQSQEAKRKPEPFKPCWQCGGMHFVKECQYSGHKCAKCDQVGHKDGYCSANRKWNRNRRTGDFKQRLSKDTISREMFNNLVHADVLQVSQVKSRKYVDIEVNGVRFTMQIDPGADFSIISRKTWETLGRPALHPLAFSAKSASGDTMQFLGRFCCEPKLLRTGTSQNGALAVLEGDRLNIFGLDFWNKFELDDLPLKSVCNQVNAVSGEKSVEELKHKYPSVFRDEIGCCSKFKVRIFLKPEARPVFIPHRRLPYSLIDPVEKELHRLENAGVISRIEFSEYAAPIVVVKRPDGRIRIVGDYSTGLNSNLESHPYPLPIADDIFAKLNGMGVFSLLDMRDAFSQFEVDEQSRRLLTLNTHKGLYSYNRLAPGIKPAPGACQQSVDTVFAGVDGVYKFIDDILVATKDVPSHMKALDKVLQRLAHHNLTLNFQKCSFLVNECKYLGVYVSSDGVRPDPDKIRAIIDMPEPTDISELRSFLGAINYYSKFVPDMKNLRPPLDALTSPRKTWNWTEECQQSFDKFKEVLGSDLLLTHYDPNLPIVIAADASSKGVGVTISHVFPDGTEQVIRHSSKSLTPTQQGYSQIEREGYALFYGVVINHLFVYGRHFILRTDHKPLLKIFGSKNGLPKHSGNRLARWALKLASYDFDIEYVPTADFGNADVLSRLIADHRSTDEDDVIASVQVDQQVLQLTSVMLVESGMPVTFEEIKTATKSDPLLQKVIEHHVKGWPRKPRLVDAQLKCFWGRKNDLCVVDDVLKVEDRIVIPKSLRQGFLQELHRSHPGIEKTRSLARSIVYWPNMDEEIKKYVQSCESCAIAGVSPPKTCLRPWPIAQRPMERVHADIAGPIDDKWVLVVVDAHSGWPEAYWMRDLRSSTVIKHFDAMFAQFGNPELLVTDNGTQFVSDEIKKFCKKRGIEHITSATYHPQSNGRAERGVETIKNRLAKYSPDKDKTEALNEILQNYRSSPKMSNLNGLSPAELFIGRKIKTSIDLVRPRAPLSLQRDAKMEQQFNAKHGAKPRKFFPEQPVYYKQHRRNKWSWIAATIVEEIGSVMYTIILNGRSGIGSVVRAHTNQLKPRYLQQSARTADMDLFDFLVNPPPRSGTEYRESTSMPTQDSSTTPTVTLRRSTRQRRPPRRFSPYVLNF